MSIYRRSLNMMMLAFALSAAYFWFYFATYLFAIVPFNFDWEPTDGDHLNFVLRILKHQPIYGDWPSGNILSIYTPGYHYLLAALGTIAEPSLSSARIVSFLAFVFSTLLVSFTVFRATEQRPFKNRLLIAFFAALAVPMSPFENMVTDLIHVTPNMLYSAFALATLFTFELWDAAFGEACGDACGGTWSWNRNRKSLTLLAAAGFLAFCSIATKQQGIFAFASGAALLFLRRSRFKYWLVYFAAFGLPLVTAAFYLESANHHSFVTSIFTNVSRICSSPLSVALKRIGLFFALSASLLAAITLRFFRKPKPTFDLTKLSIWDVSLPVQFLLLIATAGNLGGGPNYFFTFWCCLIICACRSLSAIEDCLRSSSTQFRLAAGAVIIALLCNFTYASITLSRHLRERTPDIKALTKSMQAYDRTVAALMATSKNKKVFAARTVGAFTKAGAELDQESCTFFTAWSSSHLIDKKSFIEKIKDNKFAFITTGFQPFPADFLSAVQQSYHPVSNQVVNLWLGKTGEITIYAPNLIR